MTLLLICYMCGQSEKVRLSMWLLIISAVTYIFAFGGSAIYAFDIAIQPGDDGLFNTTVAEQEVVVEAPVNDSSTRANTVTNTKNTTTVTADVEKETPIEEELSYLIALESSFPGSNVYYGNNIFFYQLLLDLISTKSEESQELYLNKTIDLINSVSGVAIKKYGLNGSGIVSALTAVKITASTKTFDNNGGSFDKDSLHSLYKMESINSTYTKLIMREGKSVKRISFYVNDQFVSGCESSQCNSSFIKAQSGDVISANVTIRSKESVKLSTRL